MADVKREGAHNAAMWIGIELRKEYGVSESVSVGRILDMLERYHALIDGKRVPRQHQERGGRLEW